MTGNLRHKIERLERVRVPDEAGGATIIYHNVGEHWASVETLSPIRDIAGDRRAFLKRIAAEIRKTPDIICGGRIRYEQSIYEVVSIETVDERQRRVVLIAEEEPDYVIQ